MKFDRYKYWFIAWFRLFGVLLLFIWAAWFAGWALSFFTVLPDVMRNTRLTIWFIILNSILAFVTSIFISTGKEDK
jgi:hypothetical protein